MDRHSAKHQGNKYEKHVFSTALGIFTRLQPQKAHLASKALESDDSSEYHS